MEPRAAVVASLGSGKNRGTAAATWSWPAGRRASCDELRDLNDRLQLRTDELNQFNGYFQTVLSTLRAAVVVMDRTLHVRVWSDKAQDFWGARPDEVLGESFPSLDIGLPVAELRQMLREVVADGREREQSLDGTDRRGKPVRCRVRVAPYRSARAGAEEVEGLILLIEETEPG